jgi:hypothetical protein
MTIKIINNLRSNGIAEIIDDEEFENIVNNTIKRYGEPDDIKMVSSYDSNRFKTVITVMLIYKK